MNDDRFLKCIVDNNRRYILECIGKSEKSVNEIIKLTNLKQTLVSFHLKALRGCGLVKTRRDGKKIMYSVSKLEILKVLNSIKKLTVDLPELCDSNECK
jgi:DNA-binding transcriptional ArsR family regulator